MLFDEFEEMILDRSAGPTEKESRLLTTSMLPRLHRIRDQGDIVFIIATNHAESLDPAAYRFGRIDRIINVTRPNASTRQKMYAKLLDDMELSEAAVKLFLDSGFPRAWVDEETAESVGESFASTLARLRDSVTLDDFGYGEIRQVVRLALLTEMSGTTLDLDRFERILTQVSAHSHPDGGHQS